jgi:hypothetical protein
LQKHVEEVIPQPLIVKVFPEQLRDLNGLVLRQLGGTRDV